MLTTLAIGLSIAMLLFLLSSGLTLIFGLLGVINFAHGALYMLGAYLAFQTVVWTESFWLALLLAPLLVGLLGVAMELALLRPLYPRDHVQQLLMTFGVILVLEEAVRFFWGLDYRSVEAPAALSEPLRLGGATLPGYRVFVILLGLAVAAILIVGIERTRLGMVLRAAQANAPMVRCLGIRVSRVRTAVFLLGSSLAALGGAVAAPILPVQVGMGFTIIVDCFMVVILGGLGSIRGALAASLLLGLVQVAGQRWFPTWVDVAIYGTLVVVLLVRPQGLFSGARSRLA